MSIFKTTIFLLALAVVAFADSAPQQATLPVFVDADMPLYFPLARQANIQGKVEVAIQVDESGKVVAATRLSGHPLLAQAAIDNAKTWRFAPRRGAGTLLYEFKIEGKVDTENPYYKYGKVIFRPPNSVEIDFPVPVVVHD